MIVVNREDFIAWTQGIFLDRKGQKLIVGDKKIHQEAKEALDLGEKIGLTINNKIVSSMQLKDNKYIEEFYKERVA